MATLHFIAGKAGAGKTTLARSLGRELPAIVICEDEWLSQIADPIHNLPDYLKASRRLRAALATHVTELLRLGVSVVFDFAGNTTRDRPGSDRSTRRLALTTWLVGPPRHYAR